MHTEGMYSNFMYKNSVCKKLVGICDVHLQEGQYNCFYTQSSDCSFFLGEDKEFEMWDVFYSPLLLEELIPFFWN